MKMDEIVKAYLYLIKNDDRIGIKEIEELIIELRKSWREQNR
jgi:hypothetical protein